ncbi:F-box/LRR-repeat protein At4g14103-like [Argentina anserina]|uniref:F-box/LRR-repeat protein At4g14103-like n=1 Tax=Argentina anserina TaxID=57926 RepID=UPI0021767C88|nr:F-box/LRR-repeat protein At4g14103-like [Potentilla anserina]
MDSTSKSQARAKDRISELPVAVLSHILSFLPTKYSLRTSILSTRWKHIWASVPNLDICDEATSDKTGFMGFVDRIMFSPQSSSIRKFRLNCSSVDDFSHIGSWVCSAIQRNAVEVDLCVEPSGERIFELPRPLLVSKTLEVLKLDSNYEINLPPGSFPSLRSLHVTVDSPDSDAMGTLISYCPVLENLTLDGTLGNWGNTVTVSAAELKSLRIRLRSTTNVLHDAHNFSINAPKLEYLDIEEDILSTYKLKNARSLVKAHAHVIDYSTIRGRDFLNRVTALMSTVSNVKYLSLSAMYLEDLCLSTFGNLSHLKLVANYCNYWDVPDLLERIPKLEYFVLEYEVINIGEDSAYQMMAMESVPNCLTSHLKSISIKGLKGEPSDLEMLKYLLRNGEVLEKMTIYAGGLLCTKEELNREVRMFKRGSKTCEVEYI